MKRRINYIISLLGCAIFFSCSKPNSEVKDNIKIIEIDNKLESYIPWHKILDSVEVIRLETKEYCTISHIKRIFTANNHFYVHDEGNHRLLIFNKTGKFVNKIEKQGAGPGEYRKLRDFFLDHEFIYILTYNRILRYTHNGSYVDDIIINIPNEKYIFSPVQFMKYKNFFYFWRGTFGVKKASKDEFSLVKCNNKMKVVESKFPIKRQFVNNKKFNKSEDNYMFTYTWGNDTIYELDEFIAPKYYVDFGKMKVDENEIPTGFGKRVANFFLELKNTNRSGSLSNVYEDKRILYFNFLKGKFYYHAIYFKLNESVFVGKLAPSPPISPLIIQGKMQDKYFSVIESYVVVSFLENNYDKEKEKKNLEELLKVDYNDNPVILLFNLKEPS